MSRVTRPTNQKAIDSWLTAKLVRFRWYDRSDRYISSESHADVIVFPAPWMAATIWLLAAMTKFGTPQCPKWEIPNLSIIHLATETGNCAWEMNKRPILRDLLGPIYKSETSNEVWISDTPPRWPHRQNNRSCGKHLRETGQGKMWVSYLMSCYFIVIITSSLIG